MTRGCHLSALVCLGVLGAAAPFRLPAIELEATPTATNAPPALTLKPSPPPPKSLTWSATWHGWNGLHLELTRRTLLGQWIPGVTNLSGIPLEPLGGSLFHAVPAQGMESGAPRLHLEESRLTAKIGGKLALDGAAYLADDALPGFDNGFELRRARLFAGGDCVLVLPVSYEIEVGYIPGEFYIENSYLEFRNLGVLGSLKGGQYQAPMGLEDCGSSRDLMFMENAAPLQALAPGVEAGVEIGRPILDRRMTWALGLFTDGVGHDFGDATKDFGRAVGRLTGLPVDDHDPASPGTARLLHLGLSGYLLYAGGETVRYRSRPESHQAPYLIDTGSIAADAAYVVGAEAAWVDGPFSLQGEYLHSWVEEASGQPVGFSGFYTAASWFLTGESRPYDRAHGTFARLIPTRNFGFGTGGGGAWELVARYSYVDLNSSGVAGGRLAMLAAGVNWHLHSHLKWRFDYSHGEVTGRQPEGRFHTFQTRFEIDF